MAKSGKRKNAGVGIDFKRAKHKVGRKLPAAANATDTTIKSATISLGQQSMAVDRAGQAVTARNLTLKVRRRRCWVGKAIVEGWGGVEGGFSFGLGHRVFSNPHARSPGL